MLVVIHNLPSNVRYAEIKSMIKDTCGLSEIILDNLSSEGKTKRVTVGLAGERDAAILVQKINGLLMNGSKLYIEDIREVDKAQQASPQEKWAQPSTHQKQNFEAQASHLNQIMVPPTIPTPSLLQPYNNLGFYNPQSSQVSYDKQTSLSTSTPHQVPFYQTPVANLTYQSDTQSQWSNQVNTSYSVKPPQYKSTSQISEERYSRNIDLEQDEGEDNRSFPGTQVNRNNKRDFDSYRVDKDYRNQSNFSKNFQSNESEEGRNNYRYDKQSPPRSHDRNRHRSNAGDGRHNSDVQYSSRSSRFDRSPPRDRSSRHDISPQRDRYRDGGSPEWGSGRDIHHELQSDPNRSNYREFLQSQRKNNRPAFSNSKRSNPTFSQKSLKSYGNNPSNSTFVVSNENIFRQQAKNNVFDMHNRKRHTNVSGPPAKFARVGNNGKSPAPRAQRSGLNSNVPLPTNVPVQKNLAEDSIKAKLIQHCNWRDNAASVLAKKVVKNANVGHVKNYKEVVQNLKKCIMSRIDVILGDYIVNSLDEMINSYRTKFSVSDDADFYNAVLDKLKRGKEETRNGPGPSNVPKNVPKQMSSRLPKYPEANKQIYKDQKRMQKLEFKQNIYSLGPEMKQALDSELNNLCDAFVSACNESSDPDEEAIRQKIINDTVQEFRKVVSVHITKRLLDIKTNLVVRIFSHPKPPKRTEMIAFLKSVGAINLKKSDKKKMFVANCDTYDSYDKLLALKSTKIGDVELTFKPLHLIGPPEKKNNKSNRLPNQSSEYENLIESKDKQFDQLDDLGNDDANHEDFVDNVHNKYFDDGVTNEDFVNDVTNEDFVNDVTNEDFANDFTSDDFIAHLNKSSAKDNLNISQDVVLIENEKDVIVIEDSDHKDNEENTACDENLTTDSNITKLTVIDNTNDKETIIDKNNEPSGTESRVPVNYQSVTVEKIDNTSENNLEDILKTVDDIAEDDLEDF